jgi:type I restriction enzyme R subunit
MHTENHTMSGMSERDLQFFDPNSDHTVVWKNLPHIAQTGTLCFITWRTADSLPESALKRLTHRREILLRHYGIECGENWRASLAELKSEIRREVHWSLFTAWDQELDSARGACVLKRPELARIVMNSLLYFDNDRYVLTDAVIMPNHVHLIAAFRDEALLLRQCTSWKHFTATEMNRILEMDICPDGSTGPRRKGSFWQPEQFDHLIRSEADFVRYRRYIAGNPKASKLRAGESLHYSRIL